MSFLHSAQNYFQGHCKKVVQAALLAIESLDIEVRTGGLYLLRKIISFDFQLVEESIGQIMRV